jgi:hypothetical protein
LARRNGYLFAVYRRFVLPAPVRLGGVVMQQFPPQVNGGLSRLGASAGAAAVVTGWWLAGGVNPADVAAVWQPIGAASLAASYLRIAGNLGHANIDPALVGGVAPTFAQATGWGLDGLSRHLRSGVLVSAGWSVIARFSSVANAGLLFGSYDGAGRDVSIYPSFNSRVYYANGGQVNVAPALTGGVLAVAGNKAYRNGADNGLTIPAWSGGASIRDVFFGALNFLGTAGGFLSGNIQAIAIYTTTLPAPQVASISAAMAALT